jgi:hypothetical protein
MYVTHIHISFLALHHVGEFYFVRCSFFKQQESMSLLGLWPLIFAGQPTRDRSSSCFYHLNYCRKNQA